MWKLQDNIQLYINLKNEEIKLKWTNKNKKIYVYLMLIIIIKFMIKKQKRVDRVVWGLWTDFFLKFCVTVKIKCLIKNIQMYVL